jgi:DNA mismatch repair protein MutS
MTTPIRRQYLEIKQRFPHAIVLFRLGDFYETFDEDAKLASRELDIMLTSKPMGKNLRVPLAGIPHHSVNSYVAKLLAKGYKVAICEQLADPATTKGIVPRDVVRVVTPGTIIEDGLVAGARNNYVAALGPGARALAYADISTGELSLLSTSIATVSSELGRIGPAELLLAEGEDAPETGAVLTQVPPLSAVDARALAEAQLGNLAALGVDVAGTIACATLLAYVERTQPAALPSLSRVRIEEPSRCLDLVGRTAQNLALVPVPGQQGSLLELLDRTKTAGGARLLRRWLLQPLRAVDEIRARQDCVGAFVQDAILCPAAGKALQSVADVERLTVRVVAGNASPRDLAALRRSLQAAPELAELLRGSDEPGLQEIAGRLEACGGMRKLLEDAIADDPATGFDEGGVVRPGYSAEADTLVQLARDARSYLAGLERDERERSGIKSLKVGYNRVFGYYIEVSNAHKDAVPAHYQRRQTLVGAERYITPELKEHESAVLSSKERLAEVEQAIFRNVCAEVAAGQDLLLALGAACAEADVYRALAEAAVEQRWTRPEVEDSPCLEVRGGRHPVVEAALPPNGFVPNDLELDGTEAQIVLLTGPNMGGKSTFLRQVALIVVLAQIGSWVPAEQARVGTVDRLFSRIGAQDDLASGRSTFMVEMMETAQILHGATARSLVILDEVGRGTSTYDGMAIARATVEYLHNHQSLNAKTLFATHYLELTKLADSLPRVRNLHVAVAEEGGETVFLHRILAGASDRSYGVHVAELAGIPRAVVERAKALLGDLEREGSNGKLPSQAPQLTLAIPSDVEAELRSLDLEALTPLEALNLLHDLQARALRKAARASMTRKA